METANKIAYQIGVCIGRIIRLTIALGLLFVIIGTIVATGEGNAKRSAAQVSKPTVAHMTAKPVKHRIKSRKKCHCECKKVLDNAAPLVVKEFIGPRE